MDTTLTVLSSLVVVLVLAATGASVVLWAAVWRDGAGEAPSLRLDPSDRYDLP